jgi:hypothetical protein
MVRIKKLLALFFFVLTAFTFFAPASAMADNTRYLIDFGSPSYLTTVSGWNNISGAQAKDTTTVWPLIDSTGAATNVTFKFTDGFNCLPGGNPVNTTGTQGSSLYPAYATVDSFYLGVVSNGVCTQNDTSATFIVSNLTQNATYDFKFYASRADFATVPANRTTNYTIGATTVQLNATNNVNNVAQITNVTPVNGVITVTVEKGANSGFGYLGVVDMVRKTLPVAPSANAGSDQTITLPTHAVTLSGSGTDTDGTIASYRWSEVSSGAATIVSSQSASTAVTDLAAGVIRA